MEVNKNVRNNLFHYIKIFLLILPLLIGCSFVYGYVIYDGPFGTKKYHYNSYSGNNVLISDQSFVTAGIYNKFCIPSYEPDLIVIQSGEYAISSPAPIFDDGFWLIPRYRNVYIKVRPHRIDWLPSPTYILSVTPYTNDFSSSSPSDVQYALDVLYHYISKFWDFAPPNPYRLGGTLQDTYSILLDSDWMGFTLYYNSEDDYYEDLMGVRWAYIIYYPDQGLYNIDVKFHSDIYVDIFGYSWWPIGSEYVGYTSKTLFADFHIYYYGSVFC